MAPLAIDLFCGLGGWTEGLLAEGYNVVGFDIERHAYGEMKYPAQLVLQDVLTIHGSQFKNAALIVASPPCQEYSYMAMPWSLAKQKQRKYEDGTRDVKQLTALFDACFRIQREAIAATRKVCNCNGHLGLGWDADRCWCCKGSGYCAGSERYIPLVVENVRGAQKWVGPSKWHHGSFHFWGDIPALVPNATAAVKGFAGFKGFKDFHDCEAARKWSSKDPRRKEWSAMIAKIPLVLSRHIASVYYPT